MSRTSALFSTLELALPEIHELGLHRKPLEACGLLLDIGWRRSDGRLSYIKELPNRALVPGQYRIEAGDIQLCMEGLDDIEEVAVWHTHPSGMLGPSEGDLHYRLSDDIPMLVVALTDAGPVPTWF